MKFREFASILAGSEANADINIVIPIHLYTIKASTTSGNHCLLVFTGESSFQGFLGALDGFRHHPHGPSTEIRAPRAGWKASCPGIGSGPKASDLLGTWRGGEGLTIATWPFRPRREPLYAVLFEAILPFLGLANQPGNHQILGIPYFWQGSNQIRLAK